MTRPLNITLVGLDRRWIDFLADGLNSRFPDRVHASAVLQGGGIASLPSFLASVIRADLVVRVGVTLSPESKIDRLLVRLSGRKLVLFWIGSDVSDWCERHASGAPSAWLSSAYDRATHIAGAPNLVSELSGAGIDAISTPFPIPLPDIPDRCPPLPQRFRVLSYCPAPRFRAYGGPSLVAAARQLSDMDFAIVGEGTDEMTGLPPNMTGLGWVADMAPEYEKSTAIVRMVEHDAIGGTVMEGLVFGRHVIYSMDLDHTMHVGFDDTDALVEALSSMAGKSNSGELAPNETGRTWALTEFDADTRFSRLHQVLREISGRAPAEPDDSDRSATPSSP